MTTASPATDRADCTARSRNAVEARNASDSTVIRQTLVCLLAVGTGGTPTLAGFAIAQVNAFAGDGEWMQTLRELNDGLAALRR